MRNADKASVMGGPAVVSGARTLVVPLVSGLRNGVYTVRWSIVSDDGHREEGLIAFAVGDGQGGVYAGLTTRGSFAWQRAAMKILFLLGVLVAGGAALFTVVVLKPLGLERVLARGQADVLFVGFLAALSGSEALLQTVDAAGTRFAQALGLAAAASVVGAVAALLTPAYARARFVVWLAAAVLVVCPTLAGHAFDPGSLRLVSVASDIVHLGAAAVWLGGLASLVYTLGRVDPEVGARAARRFAAFALVAAVLVLASGPLRALTAFSSVGQLWSTDYGRTLLVKLAVVVPLLVLAWLNRSRLLGAFARLRRVAMFELLLLSAVVAAVAVLTELPPGRADIELAGVALTPAALAEARVPPPRRAFVDARRAGDLTVGFALARAHRDGDVGRRGRKGCRRGRCGDRRATGAVLWPGLFPREGRGSFGRGSHRPAQPALRGSDATEAGR